MPRIVAIKNFTAMGSSSATEFRAKSNFGFQPDEAVIRQISYSGPNAQEAGIFHIWSSLANDYIGCFEVSNFGVTLTPHTLILLKSPLPNELSFRIDSVAADGTAIPYTGLVGDIGVRIDFIKYDFKYAGQKKFSVI